MNHRVIHIAITPDDRYVHQGIAMLNSLRQHNKNHRLIVHILHDHLSFSSRLKLRLFCLKYGLKIQFYQIKESPFHAAPLAYHFSGTVYNRLLLASILNEKIKKVLYLDCDLIVLQDLTELYDTDLARNYLAAVKEIIEKEADERLCLEGSDYFNAGVLLLNLEIWRKENLEGKFLSFINEKSEKIKYLDQDVLNYCVKNRWIPLEAKHNVTHYFYDYTNYTEVYFGLTKTVYDQIRENPSILHFSGHKKPWIEGCQHPKKELYFQYELSFKNLLFNRR
jgi:lipopolysaccharide biosynthesis glycosyltransferase